MAVRPAEEVIAWIAEREANCRRIARYKEGADARGWLEDVDYFAAALLMMQAAIEGPASLASAKRTG